jgi:hypothetical protein
MGTNDCQLRAIVKLRDGFLEAQLLEIDIAARGNDISDLLSELSHAITVSYEISTELGETPFANLMPAPLQFHSQWNEAKCKQIGFIKLSPEVAMALAIALHLRKPIESIPVFEKMAA